MNKFAPELATAALALSVLTACNSAEKPELKPEPDVKPIAELVVGISEADQLHFASDGAYMVTDMNTSETGRYDTTLTLGKLRCNQRELLVANITYRLDLLSRVDADHPESLNDKLGPGTTRLWTEPVTSESVAIGSCKYLAITTGRVSKLRTLNIMGKRYSVTQ